MEENKELEQLVDKLFEADKTDSPSMGFTNQVMAKIEALKSTKLKFKPLLPKWIFIVIGLIGSVFTWYVLKTNALNTTRLNYLPQLDANALITDLIGQFNFSSSLGYSLLAIGLVTCIQAVLLTKKLQNNSI